MLGQGVVIFLTGDKIYSPVDGEVQFVFDTKHAIGILSNQGNEILLHIGIDTVNLKGEGFTPHVQQGQKIKKGDLLMDIDLQYIKEHAKSEATPMIFTNLKPESTLTILKMGDVKALDKICEIK